MRRQLLSSVTTLGAMTVLGAAVLASTPVVDERQSAGPTFVAVGSTNNSANPSCNGKSNNTCSGNAPTKAFDVTVADMGGMYPGSSDPVAVTFLNPQSFDIKVTTLQIIAVAGSSACPTTYLNFPTSVALAPAVVLTRKGGTGSTTVPVGLKPSAVDACQNVSFDVTVTATAVMN
jgi:hypothetical protein